MTQTHRKILDKLNEAYAQDSSIENAKRLVQYVAYELRSEMKAQERLKDSQAAFGVLATLLIYSFIFMLFFDLIDLLVPKTWFNVGSFGLALIAVPIVFILERKGRLYNFLQKYLDKSRPLVRKRLDLFFQAKEQIRAFEYQEQEQALVAKYLNRNGNPIEIKKFKCENTKDTIIVPFTNNANLGMLCTAVIMQRDILPKSPFHQTIDEKIAQNEFEKNLPINVIKMIDSCQTYNMQMSSALYALIKELNISEDAPNYSYIKQFINEYE